MRKFFLLVMGIIAFALGGCCLSCCDDDTATNELIATWIAKVNDGNIKQTVEYKFENSYTFSYKTERTYLGEGDNNLTEYQLFLGNYKITESTTPKILSLTYTAGQVIDTLENITTLTDSYLKDIAESVYFKTTDTSFCLTDTAGFTTWEATGFAEFIKQ